MDNLNNIPSTGNWGDASARLNDNFSKVQQAVTTVENAQTNNKGYFSSMDALNTAFPYPKAGQVAYVADLLSSTGYYICNVSNGTWVKSSVEAPPILANIDQKADHGYATYAEAKTLKEVEDEVVQLAGDIQNSSIIKPIFVQGNFSQFGETTEKWARHSDWIYPQIRGSMVVHINDGYGLTIFESDIADTSDTTRILNNGTANLFVNGDSFTTTKKYIRIVLTKNPVNGKDVLTTMDDELANAKIEKGEVVVYTDFKEHVLDTDNSKIKPIFVQGNFSQFGETTEKWARHSEFWIRPTILTEATINLSDNGYGLTLFECNDIITLSDCTRILKNGTTDLFVNGDKFRQIKNYLRIVYTKNPISTAAVLTKYDDLKVKIEISYNSLDFDRVDDIIFVQGNFSQNGETTEKFARHSDWIELTESGIAKVHINDGYGLTIFESDIADTSDTTRILNNGTANLFVNGDSFTTTKKYIRIVLTKNPVNGKDVLTVYDDIKADVKIKFEQSVGVSMLDAVKKNNINIERSTTFNSFGSEIEKKIFDVQMDIIDKCERDFDDGSGKLYQASDVYQGIFISDIQFPFYAIPERFHLPDIKNIIKKFIERRDTVSKMFPMALNANGTIHAMYSGADQFHYLPCADSTFFIPVILKFIYDKYKDIEFFEKYNVQLGEALSSIPTDTNTGLANINAGQEWVPWGFMEIARFLGNITTGSAFLYDSYRAMEYMYNVINDSTNSNLYKTKADTIKASLSDVSSPLWDATNGMFFAATLQNKQIDIFGSSLCVALDIASDEQKASISDYLHNNFSTLTFGTGYIRESPFVWDKRGFIPPDGSTNYLEEYRYPDGFYQNGAWSVSNHWVLKALSYNHEDTALQYAKDMLTVSDFSTEHLDIPPYTASPQISSTINNLCSPSGTLRWIRENAYMFNLRECVLSPSSEDSHGKINEIDIRQDGIWICIGNNTWKKILFGI